MNSDQQQTFADACYQVLTLKKAGRKQIASGLVKLLFLSLAIVGISPVVLVTPAQATSISTSSSGIVCKSSTTNSIVVTFKNATSGSTNQYIRGFRSVDTQTVLVSGLSWADSLTSVNPIPKSLTVDLTFSGLSPGKSYYFAGDRNSSLTSLGVPSTSTSNKIVCSTSSGTPRSITVTKTNVPTTTHPGETFTARALLTAGTDTNTISWSGTTNICTVAAISGDSTTVTMSGPGTCLVTANVNALSPYAAGTGTVSQLSVGRTSVILSPATGTLGNNETITVTAQIQSNSQNLTGIGGTVTFSGGANAPCAAASVTTSTGIAVCTYKAPTSGSGYETLTASFVPLASVTTYETSTASTKAVFSYSPSVLTTSATIETNTAVHIVGTRETVTAVISRSPAGSITGLVDFTLNIGGSTSNLCLGVPVTLTSGRYVATCSFIHALGGAVSVKADYRGDATVSPQLKSAPTASVSMTVTAQPTYILITASPTAMSFGGSTTIEATVSSDSLTARAVETATGTMTFKLDGTQIETKTVTASKGVVSFIWTPAKAYLAGESLTVVYAGDSNYLTSTSNWVSVVVGKKKPIISLTPADSGPTAGSGVDTITVTVSDSATPSGASKFYVGGVGTGVNCPLDPTSAFFECPWQPGSAGETVTVIYTPGDPSNYLASDPTLVVATVYAPPGLTFTTTASSVITYGASTPSISTSITSGTLTGSDTYTVSYTFSGTSDSGTVFTNSATAPTFSGVYSITPVITFTSGSASSYTISKVNGTLTINKKPISVTANSLTKVYGSANPALGGFTISVGLVGSDTITVVTETTSAVSLSNSSTYPINISAAVGSGASANYAITYVPGVLTVTPKPLSITTPTLASRVYNGTKIGGAVTLGTLTGYIGSETLTVTASASDYETSTVGNRTSTVTYTLFDGSGKATNYSLAPNTGISGVITKATPVFTGTWTTSGIRMSTTLSATQLSPTSANWNVPGTITFTPAIGATMSAGSGQTLRAVFTPTDLTNYTTETETALIDVSSAVKPGAPTSPVLASVSGSAGTLSLNWVAPTDNGDSALVRYEYRIARADLLSWPSSWTSTVGTETSATISGLTNGKSYLAQVRAVNGVGESAFTQTSASAIPSGEAPVLQGAPSLTSAVADTTLGGKVTLNFTAPSVTGTPSVNAFLNYQYTTDGGSTWRSTSDTSTSIVVTGLTNGTSYTFKVRVVNAAGAGTSSGSQSATPRKKPEVVSSVSLTAASSRLNVLFTPPTDNGGSSLSYSYKVRKSDGSYPSSWSTVSSLSDSGTAKTFAITRDGSGNSIATGTTYYVKIKSANTWFDSDESSEVSVNATVAQVPVIDSITADSGFTSGRSFTLSVTAHAVGSETLSYRWYKSSDTATTLSTSPSYTVASAITANSGNYFVIITSTLATNGTTAQVTNTDPVTITINGPPTISNKSSIPGATQGLSYSYTLTAAGTGPITWPAVASSLLPKGLTFTNTGVNAGKISGTVDASAATTVVSMTLTDGAGVTNVETFTITVSSPLTITTRTLGSATKGVYYYSALAASGGAAPYTWSVTGSVPLPDGLNIYNDTVTAASYISDTATNTAVSRTFTLKVRDSNGVEKTATFTIAIAAQVPGTPTLSTLETTTAGGLIVNWTRPSSNYSIITGYTINYSANSDERESSEDKGSKTYSVAAGDTNTVFSYLLTTLSKGRTYSITVSAYSSAASGTSSNSRSQKVGTKPSAPKSPTITQTRSGMQVRWNKSDDDGGDNDGLNYEAECWDTVPGSTPFGISFSSREHGDSEHGDSNQERGEASGVFTQGHSYKCHVRTRNGYGTSDWSADSGEAKYTTVPSAPHIETATAVGTASGKVSITWSKVTEDGGESITSYTASGNKNGESREENKKGCTVPATSASTYSCQLSGLPSKGQMVVYVYANNKNGSSNPDSITVYVSGKTQHLTYSAISTKRVNDADFPVVASIDSGQKISLLIGASGTSSVCEKSSKGQIHLKRAGTCTVVISQNGKASSGDENKNEKEDNGSGDHNNNCESGHRDSEHPNCDDGENHGDDTEWEAITPVTLSFQVTDIAPLAPISVAARPGNAQLSINWTPASGNAGKADSYTVEVRLNSGTPADVWTNAGSAPRTVTETSTIVTGLTNGTKYQVRVRSNNSGGNSAYTVAAGYYIPVTIPDSPTITSVDAYDETSTIVIKWNRVPEINNGGSAVTGYKVTGTSTGTPGSWTCSTGADSVTATYQCSISGLKNKYTYSFTAIATNAIGNSASSNSMSTTLNGINQVITITDTPTATGWTVGSADPIINAKASSGLQVVYSSSTEGVCTVSNTSPSFGAVHFIGSGDCRIAMNQNGEGSKYNAAEIRNLTFSVDPATPSAPILKSVTSVATGLSIVWDPPTRTGGGTLTESVTAIGGGQTFNCQPSTGTHTCILVGGGIGISKGVTYSVYVTASNAAGTSDPSNTLTGVWLTVPSVPLSVSASTDSGDGRAIKLSWNKSSSDGGSAILRYEATASSAGLPDKVCSVTRTDALDSATAYTCTITGARAGATYTVKFVAINAVGRSSEASASSGQLGLSQIITVQQIGDMHFGDPDTQTVASITSAQPLTYSASSTPTYGSGAGCSVNQTTGAVKVLLVGSCTITVSQPGATDANESQYKAATPVSITFTIDPVKPGEASIKSIKTDTDTAKIDWKDTSFFGGAATSVVVEAKESGSTIGSCSSSPAVLDGDRSCTITGLTLGHEYLVVVTESNSVGPTASRSVTVKTYSPNPAAPEPVSATPGAKSGSVNWTLPSYIPESSTITSYEIQYKVTGSSPWSSVVLCSSTECGTSRSKLVEGLADNTEYEYQVRAIATTDDETRTVTIGTWSGSAFAKTYNVPSVPLNLNGLKGYSTSAKISLSWSAPASNGGTPITGYIVTANGSTVSCSSATATSCEVESLTAGISYAISVLAQNAVGSGPAASLTITTINVPQAAPTITATVAKDDVADTATVTWNGITPDQNGGSPILSYKVTTIEGASTETSNVCIVKAADLDSATAYSCTFTGVKYKTDLKFKVVATNIAGNGLSSGYTNTIRLVLAQSITFPAISSQSFSAGSVNLGATASSGATVRYTVTTSSVCSVASETSTVATFLTAGICSIRAEQNGEGTNYSAADSATVTFTIDAVAPASITLNQLTPGAGQIRATWSPRTFLGGASSAQYLLSWSRTNDFTAEDNAIIGSDTSTIITGLLAKTLYYVRVKVITPNWETGSAWSNVLSATTFDAPAAPVITSATQNAPGSVVIVWANVPETSTGGSPITGYTVEAFNANTGATVSKTCSAASSTCTIAGLSGAVYHRFRATAYNAVGSATSALFPVYPAEGIRPGAAQTITASNYTVLHTSGKFTLDAAASSGLPLAFSKVGTDSQYDSVTAGYGAGRTVCTVNPTTGEVTVDLAGTCQIAIDQDGSIDSVTASSYLPAAQKIITITVQPTAPTVPTRVAVIPSPRQLNISWSTPEDDGGVGVSFYDLYYWNNETPGTVIHYGVQVAALNRLITDLTNGTKYGVSIKATNVAGLQGDGS